MVNPLHISTIDVLLVVPLCNPWQESSVSTPRACFLRQRGMSPMLHLAGPMTNDQKKGELKPSTSFNYNLIEMIWWHCKCLASRILLFFSRLFTSFFHELAGQIHGIFHYWDVPNEHHPSCSSCNCQNYVQKMHKGCFRIPNPGRHCKIGSSVQTIEPLAQYDIHQTPPRYSQL